MEEAAINLFFDEYVPEEILQNISNIPGEEALLTEPEENALNTFEYRHLFQEPQTNGIIQSSATGALPSVDRHLGSHNFEAFISSEANGPDCLYSHKLNKIFVNLEKPVPVMFRMTSHMQGLYVRALAIYLNCRDSHIPVRRCVTHRESDKEGNKDIDLLEHVVRCISPNASYCQAPDSGRYSVRVQLDAPQTGTDLTKICFKFTCLSSCRSRAKMGIIFTLENEKGDVLGRQFMYVRVCSCPRRDKEKEEVPKDKTKIPLQVLKKSRGSDSECDGGKPKKILKSEPAETALVSIPVKLCQLKEFAKFASDLIYRDIGMQQRAPTAQEKQLIAEYRHIIETPEETLYQWITSE